MARADLPHDPYLALRLRDFRFLLIGNVIVQFGGEMLTLAIGWELYARTGSALALGLVGLVQVLPILALSLVAGHVADRYDRRAVVIAAQALLIAGSLGLTYLSATNGPLVPIYGCLLLLGVGAAFGGPAARALPAEVVPESAFENAVTWSNSIGQVATVGGPAVGGLIIASTGQSTLVYLLDALAGVIYAMLLFSMRPADRRAPLDDEDRPVSFGSLGSGITFLRKSPILLGAITLDLFGVLFGGATALLPIFAKDILQVGPTGFGWLRAAPSVGAVLVALYLAHQPPLRRAGPTLLAVVTGFGLVTIGFGLSRVFWLSLLALALLGGLDNVSMVIRHTLLLTRTPDAMRGRVAAINNLFVSASNELGGFESGLTAQLFGPIVSVVGGGIGTVLVALVVALVWPDVRRMTTLRAAAQPPIARGEAEAAR
jgi:MFS family permease